MKQKIINLEDEVEILKNENRIFKQYIKIQLLNSKKILEIDISDI